MTVHISSLANSDRTRPVALISMPTLSGRFPSFQLALLQPVLERAGIPTQVFSLFMYFGNQIGWKVNEAIADVWPSLVGEWIWSKAAFGDEIQARNSDYFHTYKHIFREVCLRAGCTTKRFQKIRDEEAPRFIAYCVDAVDWSRFGLIGFSVVFQQMVASIAMAKAVKARYPKIPIVFGGASLEDDIALELINQCGQVDYVHCGDAEQTFPDMVWRLHRGESVSGMPGVLWRNGNKTEYAGRAPNFMAMDETPTPNYDEYFYARTESKYEEYEDACEPMLAIETARGCWWGEKYHCTFCGLNRSGMEFRSKSPEKAVEQLEILSRKYDVFSFNAIDNIMAPAYGKQLFGRLAESNSDLQIHYEIRPSFTREQLKEMRKGGLYSVQPGIESLSTHVLKIMRKMSTGVRNIELMKWCTYYGINNMYNILMGFPGETEEDYRLQADLVPKIVHLQPPYGIVKARADRGSPMFTDPESQSITRLRYADCYNFIFPKERFDLNSISYYFDHDIANVVEDAHYALLLQRVARWQASWSGEKHPTLSYRKTLSTIVIRDGRKGKWREYRYNGNAAALYEYCADARTKREITASFQDLPWLDDCLDEFVALDLVLFLDDRYLSLALPENPNFSLEPRVSDSFFARPHLEIGQ
jgi:ribosomal peptide maturation radical SAM protein 1